MQQSSATQSLHFSFWGLRKIVACSHSSSQCLLVSTVFGTVSSLHPTSFLMIFILVLYTVAFISRTCNVFDVPDAALLPPTMTTDTIPLFLDSLFCTGSESSLVDCPPFPHGLHECASKEIVTLKCTGNHSSNINYTVFYIFYLL